MSRDGLSTANFLGGAMQGYQFMAGVEENKQRAQERKQIAGLRDADAKMREEAHNVNMKLNEQNSALNDSKMKEQQDAELFRMNQINVRKMRAMEGAGVEYTPVFDVTRDFGAWLRGIVRNKWRDHLRRHRREVDVDDATLEALKQNAA